MFAFGINAEICIVGYTLNIILLSSQILAHNSINSFANFFADNMLVFVGMIPKTPCAHIYIVVYLPMFDT